MRASNFKFTLRFSAGFSLLLAMLIALTVMGLSNINQAQVKLDQVMNDVSVKIAVVESMTEMIKNVEIYTVPSAAI